MVRPSRPTFLVSHKLQGVGSYRPACWRGSRLIYKASDIGCEGGLHRGYCAVHGCFVQFIAARIIRIANCAFGTDLDGLRKIEIVIDYRTNSLIIIQY